MFQQKIYTGLDLSQTAAGIVMLDAEGACLYSLVVGYPLTRESSVRELIERNIDITSAIIKQMKVYDNSFENMVMRVGIENYAFGTVRGKNKRPMQSSSMTGLAELHGLVKAQIWMGMHVEPVLFAPAHARKVVLGKGRFKGKDELVRAVNAYGFSVCNHNIADAFVIAECTRLQDAKEVVNGKG